LCARQIAVEGCCHGELDAIYAAIQETERREGVKVDLLLCCGDFEAGAAKGGRRACSKALTPGPRS